MSVIRQDRQQTKALVVSHTLKNNDDDDDDDIDDVYDRIHGMIMIRAWMVVLLVIVLMVILMILAAFPYYISQTFLPPIISGVRTSGYKAAVWDVREFRSQLGQCIAMSSLIDLVTLIFMSIVQLLMNYWLMVSIITN